MLQVAIHENIILEKAPAVNDKGTLEIYMKKVVDTDPLAVFSSTTDNSSTAEEKNTFMEFNPLAVNKFGAELTVEQISKDYANFKDKLSHILLAYKTSDSIKWDLLRGTGITGANKESKLKDQAILDILYKNLCEDFIKNLVGVDLSKPCRVKVTRQSKAKHYGKLPDSKFGFSGNNAFIEPMTVPKEQSKLAYSAYEIREGLNSGAPATASAPLSADEAASQTSAFASVFGA